MGPAPHWLDDLVHSLGTQNEPEFLRLSNGMFIKHTVRILGDLESILE